MKSGCRGAARQGGDSGRTGDDKGNVGANLVFAHDHFVRSRGQGDHKDRPYGVGSRPTAARGMLRQGAIRAEPVTTKGTVGANLVFAQDCSLCSRGEGDHKDRPYNLLGPSDRNGGIVRSKSFGIIGSPGPGRSRGSPLQSVGIIRAGSALHRSPPGDWASRSVTRHAPQPPDSTASPAGSPAAGTDLLLPR